MVQEKFRFDSHLFPRSFRITATGDEQYYVWLQPLDACSQIQDKFIQCTSGKKPHSLQVKEATSCCWMGILTAAVLTPVIKKGVPSMIILSLKSHSQTASFGIIKWLWFNFGMHSPHCCHMSWHCPCYILFFWHSLSREDSRDNSRLTYLFTWG